MKCPLCGRHDFYVKDPEDEYCLYRFSTKNNQVEFEDEAEAAACPEIKEETKIYCDYCAWNGPFQKLLKA